MKKIVIVDDDRDTCLLLEKFLKKNEFEVSSFHDGKSFLQWFDSNAADLLLCDFRLPDFSGLEILEKIKVQNKLLQTIIITGYSDVRIAVKALKKGAYDYVTKPLYPDEILLTVKKALNSKTETRISDKKAPSKESKRKNKAQADYLVGKSSESKLVHKHIELIAPTDMSVIITGETGTGKEYVARAIHQKSNRSDKPFIAIDCGALPKELAGSELFGHVKGSFTGAVTDKKGSFEEADGGTLFLDEIGNLSYENQIKLLRVLQERQVKRVGGNKNISVDIRIIVATNESLKQAVINNAFREDIYHRLNEFNINLTPLRERKDDIEPFALLFLELANEELNKQVEGFEPNALKKIKEYSWYGNLRELKNIIKRATLVCDKQKIHLNHLHQEILNPITNDNGFVEDDTLIYHLDSLKEVAEYAEKKAILKMLQKTNFNKAKTARNLKVDRKTLYNKISAYGIGSEED